MFHPFAHIGFKDPEAADVGRIAHKPLFKGLVIRHDVLDIRVLCRRRDKEDPRVFYAGFLFAVLTCVAEFPGKEREFCTNDIDEIFRQGQIVLFALFPGRLKDF